jgi:molybdenum cofactor cytidylyltransferase
VIVTPIILAAGESRRMGSPKALLDFDGVTSLAMVLDTCLRSDAAMPVLVVGQKESEVMAGIPAGFTLRVAVNARYQLGQTSSLKAGIRALPAEADAFLLYPVDVPLIRVSTVDALILAGAAAEGAVAPAGAPVTSRRPIVIPTFRGRRGHPALFHRSLVSEFLALGDDEPAHTVVRKNAARVFEVPVEDESILTALNTPEEYRAALAAYRAGGPSRVG